MELEEMQTLWAEMTADMEKQKKLTSTLIMKMTQVNYRNKINKVRVPEMISSVGCVAMAGYILVNIQQLSTWYLLACGIICIVTLCAVPYLSLSAIRKLSRVNIAGNNYKQSLQDYSTSKLQFVRARKINFMLGALLMVAILPVMVMLMDGKDVFKTDGLWYYYVVCFPVFYGVSRWVFKCYVKTVTDAENILKELEG